jgi:subtilisin family serine protease
MEETMLKKISIVLAILLALSMLSLSVAGAATNQAGEAQTYLVLYKQTAVPSGAASSIANAGGTLVYSYDKIGVAIASSADSAFSSKLLADKRVEGVSATAAFGVKLENSVDDAEIVTEAALAQASPIDDEPLGYMQWDMRQIHVPEAHAITTGDPSVVVGDIDTGLDYTHPDLAANVDFSRSVSCVGGVPNQDPAAWMDHSGHGTHTAGTIAAAHNGIGVIGVAPNVKIAAIKAGNDDGYFFPEAVVCAFMWAGDHGIDVTNNSYFADPWLFNCRNDPVQHAIWKAEQRAIRYAMQRGVTVVASAGNENQDLAHPTIDTISPDFPPGSAIPREVTNACVRIPVEIPGVIGVSGNGYNLQKAYYSDYGVSAIQVVAPGGDRRFQIPPAPILNGRVLSTFPGNSYVWLQGTSMAGPHVAGVAALILSQYGKMPPGAVQAMITQTADPQPCPEVFNPGPPFDFFANCTGGEGYNGFYGHGQVNALRAVTHAP